MECQPDDEYTRPKHVATLKKTRVWVVPTVFCQVRSQNCEKRPLASSCLSVCPHGTTRLQQNGRSWNLVLEYFFENLQKIYRFHWKLTRITGTLLGYRYTFMILSRSFLLRMRNVSKSYRKSTHTCCVHKVVPKIVPSMKQRSKIL